jgi:iron(III) transport system substrate-binding protein
MKLSRRTFTLAAPATLLAAPLFTPSIARAADSITVYNAQHASLTKAWADGFTKETGIKVTLRNGDDSEMGNQIVKEGSASPADVFLTENSPAMVLVDKAGLFTRLPQALLDQVYPQFRAGSGQWVGIAARSTVFAYNKARLTEKQLPASMLDLAGPQWKGRWAASPSGADFQAIVSALLELKGASATEAWLKGMKANAVVYRGNGNALRAVNAGEVDGALIYHYYWFGDQAKTGENSGNTALHYFRRQDPGAFVSLSGGGVLASSAHKSAAEAFLRWITGKGGQDVLRTGNSFEYAVGVGAASNPKLVPLADLQAPKVEPSGLNSAEVTALMLKAGLL